MAEHNGTHSAGEAGLPWVCSDAAWAIAGVCAWTSIAITVYQIYQHLKHYNRPAHQRWIVRILFMVPIYSFFSWLSLKYFDDTHLILYFDATRNVYEAFVIYVFVSLCFEYIGGESAILAHCNGRMNVPMWLTCTCCLAPFPYGVQFLRFIKQGCLQFCVIKPLMAVVTIATVATESYGDGDFGPNTAYLYVSIVYNTSIGIALSALLLFYAATRDLLAPYRPVLKFFIVKAVIFFAFWQGFGLMIAVNIGMIEERDNIEASQIAMAYQNFIICMEMVLASIGLLKGFPVADYQIGGAHYEEDQESGSKKSVIKNLSNTLNPADVVQDTVRNFSKKYKKYARGSIDPANAVDNAESDSDTDTEQDPASVGDSKKAKKKKRGKARGYSKMGSSGGLPAMEDVDVDEDGNPVDSLA